MNEMAINMEGSQCSGLCPETWRATGSAGFGFYAAFSRFLKQLIIKVICLSGYYPGYELVADLKVKEIPVPTVTV